MAEILESVMLICFGLSWPLAVAKNIKARSAKNMSIQFILLVIVGYIAGITAKICTHSINYVLAVYVLNLAIVSVNMAVYFVNRRYDRISEKKIAAAAKERRIAAQEEPVWQANMA